MTNQYLCIHMANAMNLQNNKEKLVISNASLKTIEKRLKTINFIKEEKNEK